MAFESRDPMEQYSLAKDLMRIHVSDLREDSELLHKLVDQIQYHQWRYYLLNDPIISDAEFDVLFNLLKAYESSQFSSPSATYPTLSVGSDLNEHLPKLKHKSPMLSLDNAYSPEDLKEFDKRIKKWLGLAAKEPITYTAEPKFDGGSIAVVYQKNKLSTAATRGNGEYGDDITHNARVFTGLPQAADFSSLGIAQAELRGEALISKKTFQKINQERELLQLPLFANPRNTATGGLRMKNPKEAEERQIEVFIYQLGYAEDEKGENMLEKFQSHFHTIEKLEELKIRTAIHQSKKCTGIEEVIDFCEKWDGDRENYDYEIDGMVIKVDERSLQEKAGYTAHHPRWAIAYKFKAKQASSKLMDVEFQVGKTGAITPVAKIQPVALAGVTISSISLHNEDFIAAKDLKIGDVVWVERAGDVIPYITGVNKELRSKEVKEIQFPTHCPSCQTPLVRSELEAAWRCPNSACPEQMLQKIIFHVGKEAMDIEGLGKSLVEKLVKLGEIKSLPDVYRLNYTQLEAMEGMGKKSVENLKQAIERAKKRPLHRLLNGLSIHHLGKKASKLIAANVAHWEELCHKSPEDLTQIKEVGPVLANNLIEYFSNPDNVSMIRELETLGVNTTATEEDISSMERVEGPLSGKTILFTGSLSQMTRKEAQELAEKVGAKNLSAVSSQLNILVAGEKAGSKLQKAQKIEGIQILTEEDFLSLVKQGQ
jgi:DNA ligase (NAD+)